MSIYSLHYFIQVPGEMFHVFTTFPAHQPVVAAHTDVIGQVGFVGADEVQRHII